MSCKFLKNFGSQKKKKNSSENKGGGKKKTKKCDADSHCIGPLGLLVFTSSL